MMDSSGGSGKRLLEEVGFSSANGGLATLTAPSILRSASPTFKPQRVTSFAPTVQILEDKRGSGTLSTMNSSDIYDEIDGLSEGLYKGSTRNSSSDSIRSRYVQNLMEDVRRDNQSHEDNIGKPCWDCKECLNGYLPHEWRKTCKNCKCPRDAHDLYHDEWISVRNSLGLTYATDPVQRLSFPRTYPVTPKGFSWAPPNLSLDQVEDFYKNFNPDKVPKTNSPGEQYRDRQLSLQIPKQDLALAYCKHVKAEDHSQYETFVEARNEVALDVGFVAPVVIPGSECPTCRSAVPVGKLAVFAPKVDDSTCWHPHCFTCTHCNEHLVDLTYCKYKGKELYCERHYAEKMKRRCAACDELIFSGEFTSAMNKDFHPQHFCCWQCDESLSGKRYVLRDEHPYCVGCYEAAFANTCDQCNQIIGIGSKDLSYKDKHWHEACFYCFKCRLSLVDRQFGSKADKIYCSPCYEAQFAARCDACGDVFKAGTKKMEYKTRQWHEKCFACCICKTPIGTKSFIPREQEIYCAGCYEEKFATRCVKCNKVITSGGVTYKNDPWHRSCFTCTHCNIELAGQRFTSKDDKPYCADCYGELFAKRCFACAKPITGIGGTRFISFEERHWHNDCFICAMCKTSLVGRGFIADGDDIICPDCAKSKLIE